MEFKFMVVSTLSNFNFKLWKPVLSLWHPSSRSCPSLSLPERVVLSSIPLPAFPVRDRAPPVLTPTPILEHLCMLYFFNHYIELAVFQAKPKLIMSTMRSLAGRIVTQGITHASTTTALLIWQPWNVPHRQCEASHCWRAIIWTCLYSVVVVKELGGILTSHWTVGGASVSDSETPTEQKCVASASAPLHWGKASGSNRISLCNGKGRITRDYVVNLGVGHNLLTKLHLHPLKGA